MIIVERIYDHRKRRSEYSVLVDRIWPRGVKKAAVGTDAWHKELAPSSALRTWFDHDPAKWEQFKFKYKQELERKKELLAQIKTLEKDHGTVILLYAAKDNTHNNAVVLKEVLDSIGRKSDHL
jgi:uncharacterized protein YeaO (DUF488 family)